MTPKDPSIGCSEQSRQDQNAESIRTERSSRPKSDRAKGNLSADGSGVFGLLNLAAATAPSPEALARAKDSASGLKLVLDANDLSQMTRAMRAVQSRMTQSQRDYEKNLQARNVALEESRRH